MQPVFVVVYYVLFFFWLLLSARLVVEYVRAETIYTVTDPPVRLARRVIPMVRIGGVGLDLSIMVVFLLVYILMQLSLNLTHTS